jgi:hypothetical protein
MLARAAPLAAAREDGVVGDKRQRRRAVDDDDRTLRKCTCFVVECGTEAFLAVPERLEVFGQDHGVDRCGDEPQVSADRDHEVVDGAVPFAGHEVGDVRVAIGFLVVEAE